MAELSHHDHVHLLDLGDNENRFNTDSLASINACLDEVEGIEGPRTLVMIGQGKIFSNGLDLDWMLAGDQDVGAFIADVLALLGRVLTFPTPTIAALNGHAFAGGAMLATAHDRVLMREDRGYWCVNELALGMQFAPGMQSLLQARLRPDTFHKAATSAHRFAAPEAVEAGIVDEALPLDALRDRALELGAELAPLAGPTLGVMKQRMYAPAVAVLAEGRGPDPI